MQDVDTKIADDEPGALIHGSFEREREREVCLSPVTLCRFTCAHQTFYKSWADH